MAVYDCAAAAALPVAQLQLLLLDRADACSCGLAGQMDMQQLLEMLVAEQLLLTPCRLCLLAPSHRSMHQGHWQWADCSNPAAFKEANTQLQANSMQQRLLVLWQTI
jgi:hypothetical protein